MYARDENGAGRIYHNRRNAVNERREEEEPTAAEREKACQCGLTPAQRKVADEVFDWERWSNGPWEACHLAVAAVLAMK